MMAPDRWPLVLLFMFDLLVIYYRITLKGSDGLMDKVSAPQPRDRGFEPYTGHDQDSSWDTSTGWFQAADLRVI